METKHFEPLLDAKEAELTAEIARFEENAKSARTAEVEDVMDVVVSAEAKETAAFETSLASDILVADRAAKGRIASGEYGVCADCGKPIEEKRLEAVPWALYCLKDQEKHDRQQADAASA